MESSKNTVFRIYAAKPEDGAKIVVSAKEKIKSISWQINDANETVLLKGKGDYNDTRVEFLAEFDAEMWSVEKPVLYSINGNICYQNGDFEELSDKFGFRYFSVDEKYIYLKEIWMFQK